MSRTQATVGSVVNQSLVYAISAWAGRFFSVISTPILTRILSPEDYGIVDFIATLQAAVVIVLSLGIDAGFRRYYTDAEDEASRHAYLGTGYIVWGGLNCLLVLLVLINAGWIAENLVGDASLTFVVQVAAVAMLGETMRRMSLELLRDNMVVKTVAATSVFSLFVRLSLSVFFVAVLSTGVVGLYYAAIIASFAAIVLEVYAGRSYLGFSLSWPRLRQMLGFGLPLIPARVATYLIFYSDRYFINYFVGLSDLGVYAVGNKVANLLALITSGFVTAWGPFVLNSYRSEGANNTFAQVFRLYSALLYVMTMGISIFSVEVLLILTTREFVDAYQFTPLLVYSLVLYGIGFYFSVGIDITSKTYHRTWISGLVIVLNPALNLLLIPPYGTMGAAVATLLSYIVYCSLSLIVSERIYPIGFALGRFTLTLLVGGIAIIGVYQFQVIDVVFTQIVWKSCLVFVLMALPLIFGLVSVGEVKEGIAYIGGRLRRRSRSETSNEMVLEEVADEPKP